MKDPELDKLAARALELGAPGQVFERLRRLGWREASYGQGDGLGPCPPDCGVCHPVYAPTRRKA